MTTRPLWRSGAKQVAAWFAKGGGRSREQRAMYALFLASAALRYASKRLLDGDERRSLRALAAEVEEIVMRGRK